MKIKQTLADDIPRAGIFFQRLRRTIDERAESFAENQYHLCKDTHQPLQLGILKELGASVAVGYLSPAFQQEEQTLKRQKGRA